MPIHSNNTTFIWAVIGLAAAALMACDDDTTDTTPNGTGGSSTSSGTTSSGGGSGGTTSSSGTGGGMDPSCVMSQCDGACTIATCNTAHVPGNVGIVQAQLQDLNGDNPGEVMAEVCGFNICKSGESNASGAINVNGGGDELISPHLQYGAGREWVRMAVAVPQLPDHDFGTISLAPLPAFSAGAPFVVGQDVTQGDVTLGIPEGAELYHNCLLYIEPSERVFRSVQIPLTATLPAVDPSLNLELLYGLAPIRTEICPPAGITVPNDANWEPNAAVELYLHGSEIFEDYAPFGGWAKFADGHVSDDGNTVSTDPGQGLGQLGVIGIRLAQ